MAPGADLPVLDDNEPGWTLSLDNFIARHLERDAELLETGAQYTPCWHLVRMVKSYLREGESMEAAFADVDRVANQFESDGLKGWACIYTASDVDSERAYLEFTTAWGKVRNRADEDAVAVAVTRARLHPISWPRKNPRPMPAYERFLTVAAWLQFGVGDRAIALPVRLLAENLRTDIRQISMWRRRAESEGFLSLVEPHKFRSNGGSRATTFTFNDSLMPLVRETYKLESGRAKP